MILRLRLVCCLRLVWHLRLVCRLRLVCLRINITFLDDHAMWEHGVARNHRARLTLPPLEAVSCCCTRLEPHSLCALDISLALVSSRGSQVTFLKLGALTHCWCRGWLSWCRGWLSWCRSLRLSWNAGWCIRWRRLWHIRRLRRRHELGASEGCEDGVSICR